MAPRQRRAKGLLEDLLARSFGALASSSLQVKPCSGAAALRVFGELRGASSLGEAERAGDLRVEGAPAAHARRVCGPLPAR